MPSPRTWDGYDNPPGMMWHEGSTDFDPSTTSPAGQALIGWRFLRSLAWGGRNRLRWVRIATKTVLLGLLVAFLFAYIASAVPR